MYTLSQIALKICKANKSLILSSIISIVISVVLIVNMFSLTSNTELMMEKEFIEQYGYTDFSVDLTEVQNEHDSIIHSIRSMKDVEEVSRVIVGHLQVGEEQYDIYSVGIDNSELSKSRYKYKSKINSNQVILNEGLAKSLNAELGDTVLIMGKQFDVIEIYHDIINSSGIPDFAFINVDTYSELLKNKVPATHLLIDIKDNANIIEVADKITSINNNISIDIFRENEEVQRNLKSIKSFMILLSFILIVMCSLFLISNFQTFLYKYRKQFSLIRAIGGSSKQAFKIVFIQSFVVSVVGIILGIICSYFFHDLIQNKLALQLFSKQYSYNFEFTNAIRVSFIIFIAIELFMLIPAIKCSKLLPLGIIEENEELDIKGNGPIIVGYLSFALSAVLFIAGFYKSMTLLGLMSSILFVIGSFFLFPLLITKLLLIILPIIQKLLGNISYVAVKSVIPQVKKNAVIILAISSLITISVFGGTAFNTIKLNSENYLRGQYKLDIVVTNREGVNNKVDYDFNKELKNLNSVSNVVSYSNINIFYFNNDGKVEYLRYVMTDFESMKKEGLIGSFNHSSESGIIISKEFAKKNKLSVGDKISVSVKDYKGKLQDFKPDNSFKELVVDAIFDNVDDRMEVMVGIDWSNEYYINEYVSIEKSYIATNSVNDTYSELQSLSRKYPNIKWSTLEEALKVTSKMHYQRWLLFIIVILAVLIGLLIGSMNMLISNVLDKRREYAILRTFKVNKKDLITTILTQIIMFNLIGIILGGIVGAVISNIFTLCEARYFCSINLQLVSYVSLAIMVLSLLVFIPIASRLSKISISNELK